MQRGHSLRPVHVELAEGRKVDQRGAAVQQRRLAVDDLLPGLFADRQGQRPFGIVRGVPKPAFPPGGQAKDGPRRRPAVMQDGPAQPPPRLRLLERPVDREDIGDGLFHPCLDMGGGGGQRIDAGDVDLPQVHRRRAFRHPVGQHPPDPGRGHDADRIHPGRDKQAIHLIRLADQRATIDGKTLRPVHEMRNPGLFQRGDQRQRRLHEGGELVPILGEFQKRAVALRPVRVPAFGMRFEPADHQLARVTLDIDPPVQIAQHRVGMGQMGHRLGHDIHMLDRLQRQRDPDGVGQFF